MCRAHRYAGRVLPDDHQTLLEAKVADNAAVHLVVAAAPAPAPRPFVAPGAAAAGAGSAGSGTLGFLVSSGAALLRKDGSRVSAESLRGKVVALYFSAHWCPPCRGFTPKLKEFYEAVNAGESYRARSLFHRLIRIATASVMLSLIVSVTPEDRKFEVIFVSSDRTAQEMASYFTESHGNWLSLDYSARDVKDSLSQCGPHSSSLATSRACPRLFTSQHCLHPHLLATWHHLAAAELRCAIRLGCIRRNNVRGIPTLVVFGRNGQMVTADGRNDVMQRGTAAFDSWAVGSS